MSMGVEAPSSGYGTGPGVANADPAGTLVQAQPNESPELAEPSNVTGVLMAPFTSEITACAPCGLTSITKDIAAIADTVFLTSVT
jgi:hypothetical protein